MHDGGRSEALKGESLNVEIKRGLEKALRREGNAGLSEFWSSLQ